MCLFGNLPFSIRLLLSFFLPLTARPGCREIFILFFDDDLSRPGNLYTFGSESQRKKRRRRWASGKTEENKSEGGTERKDAGESERRGRSRKNHDAIIFVPARERILRPSGPDRWTEERKEKEHKKTEGQEEGLTSSSG